MYLFYYYVPKINLVDVNKLLFKAGLGKFDSYDSCCWITDGRGQFRPLEGSNPFIGEPGIIEEVKECKVELICPRQLKAKAIAVLNNHHPYETPAYGFIELVE